MSEAIPPYDLLVIGNRVVLPTDRPWPKVQGSPYASTCIALMKNKNYR